MPRVVLINSSRTSVRITQEARGLCTTYTNLLALLALPGKVHMAQNVFMKRHVIRRLCAGENFSFSAFLIIDMVVFIQNSVTS